MNALRNWLIVLCALISGLSSTQAQNFPAKQITIVVPSAPGGVVDTLGRLIAKRFNDSWGQPVVVVNKPGANNVIGALYVAKTPPDGYTLLLSPESTFVYNPSFYKDMPYNAERDFVPVIGLVAINQALIAHPSFPADSVKALLDLAKRMPNEINYATAGIGSSPHVNMEMFQVMAGVKLTAVHYRAATPALTDVIGGHVPIMSVSLGSAVQPWKAGQLRMLGIGSAKRLPTLPDVPTVAESGVSGFEARSWYGLFAPAKTPRDVVAKINEEVSRMIAEPAFREEVLVPQFFEPIAGPADEFAHFVESAARKWGKILRDANVKVE
jgi:tripartite-type tricarboxylate transporter receptor subunit TctC